MEDQYYSDGKNRFLRLPAPEQGAEPYKIRMMNMNRPENLLHLHLSYEGTKPFYDYHVSGLVSLRDSVNVPMLEQFLYGVVFALEHLSDVLREHLLSEEELDLEPEHIFLQMDTGQVFFCYTPGIKTSLSESLRKVMEFFMKNMNPGNEDDVLLLYGLYQKSRESGAALTSLADYWRGNRGKSGFAKEEEVIDAPEDVEEEDRNIYRELGLAEARPKGLFDDWRERQKLVSEEKTAYGKGFPGGKRGTGASDAEIIIQEGAGKECNRFREEEYSNTTSTPKGSVLRWIKKKVKEYAFEIAVGVVVLIGVIYLIFSK